MYFFGQIIVKSTLDPPILFSGKGTNKDGPLTFCKGNYIPAYTNVLGFFIQILINLFCFITTFCIYANYQFMYRSVVYFKPLQLILFYAWMVLGIIWAITLKPLFSANSWAVFPSYKNWVLALFSSKISTVFL